MHTRCQPAGRQVESSFAALVVQMMDYVVLSNAGSRQLLTSSMRSRAGLPT